MSGQILDVSGTVGQVDAVFATHLESVTPPGPQPPGERHGRFGGRPPGPATAPDSALSIPPALAVAAGVTGLVRSDLAPLSTTMQFTAASHVTYAPASAMHPTPPGGVASATQGPMTVTAQLLDAGRMAPGMAVHYLVTVTLNGAPDTAASLLGLSGPFAGAPGFVDTTVTNAAGQFALDFTTSQAQTLSLAMTVGDGKNSVTVQLPAAVFAGPDVNTCNLGGGATICPFNPALNSLNAAYGATALSEVPASKGAATLAVFTAGAVTAPSVADVGEFASTFGLAPPSVSVAYAGASARQPTDATCAPFLPGYEVERSLDLQMLETASPGANIQIYESGSLRDALNQVVRQDSAKVFSVSYGAGEIAQANYDPTSQATWHPFAEEANVEGITISVAAGDSGAFEGAVRAVEPHAVLPVEQPVRERSGRHGDLRQPGEQRAAERALGRQSGR